MNRLLGQMAQRRAALLTAALVLLILVPAWWLASGVYRQHMLNARRSQTEARIAPLATTLSAALNQRFGLLAGLAALALSHPDEEELSRQFTPFAAGLSTGVTDVRVLALFPGGVGRYVYPLAGNEAVIGQNLLADPRLEVSVDVRRALATRRVVVSAPYPLIQGGVGLVARQAIYQGNDFWGLAGIGIDSDALLRNVGLDPPPAGLLVAVEDGAGRVVAGSSGVPQQQPAMVAVPLPDAMWKLDAVPDGGWSAGLDSLGDYRAGSIGGLVVVGLCAVIGFLVADRDTTLQRAVRSRTAALDEANATLRREVTERRQMSDALRDSEARFRAIADTSPVMIWVLSPDNVTTFANRQLLSFTGWPAGNVAPETWVQAIHPDDLATVRTQYLPAVQEGRPFSVRFRLRRHDGVYRTLAVRSATLAPVDGQPGEQVVTAEDVTERDQAQEALERQVAGRTRELAALLQMSREVAGTLELSVLPGIIFAHLRSTVAYRVARLWLVEGGDLVLLAEDNPEHAAWSTVPWIALASHESYQRVVRDGQTVSIGDLYDAGSPAAAAFREILRQQMGEAAASLRAVMLVPLIVRNNVTGVLSIASDRPHAYSPHEVELALAFASQAALPIENARLFQQAQRAAAVEERQRLARELHDSVAQYLHSVSLLVEAGRRYATSGLGDRADDVLNRAGAATRQALSDLRLLVYNLRPLELERTGLVRAIQQRLDAVEGRAGIDARLDVAGEIDLSPAVEAELFGIALAALNNALKHAGAETTTVSLRVIDTPGTSGEPQRAAGGVAARATERPHVELTVVDNGQGFDPATAGAGGYGLGMMRERAERVNGQLDVWSAPGQGTRVRVVVPVPGGEKGGTGGRLRSSDER